MIILLLKIRIWYRKRKIEVLKEGMKYNQLVLEDWEESLKDLEKQLAEKKGLVKVKCLCGKEIYEYEAYTNNVEDIKNGDFLVFYCLECYNKMRKDDFI